MNKKQCEKCGGILPNVTLPAGMIQLNPCSCKISNQEQIEAYLKDGHEVEFLDGSDSNGRCVIFKKFKERFHGVYWHENTEDWNNYVWNIGQTSNFTNIKIYKPETNEEKIKRLLKDGKVECKDSHFAIFIISDYWNERFYGRVLKDCKWDSNWSNECMAKDFTNITPYTNANI